MNFYTNWKIKKGFLKINKKAIEISQKIKLNKWLKILLKIFLKKVLKYYHKKFYKKMLKV